MAAILVWGVKVKEMWVMSCRIVREVGEMTCFLYELLSGVLCIGAFLVGFARGFYS